MTPRPQGAVPSPDGGDLPALTEQYLDERVKRGQVPPSRVELVRDFSRWLAAHGVGALPAPRDEHIEYLARIIRIGLRPTDDESHRALDELETVALGASRSGEGSASEGKSE